MSQRKSKRQRQKERRAAKREAQFAAYLQARRKRTIALTVLTAVLIVGGAAVAFFATRGEEEAATGASPSPPAATPEPVACGGEVPPQAGEEKPTFAEPEDQSLEGGKRYIFRLETSCGRIDILLAHEAAPVTANSVAFLTRQGFYDGLTFHRVVPEFVIQGGDPEGTGAGGPGYETVEAPPPELEYNRRAVAMAKTGASPPGTAGSQFFIVIAEQAENLKADCDAPDAAPGACGFALVGAVVEGMEVVDRIAQLSEGDGPPSEAVYIEDAEIVEQ